MKKMMKRFLFSITAAAAALCLAIPAFAATATSTLTVSMSLGVPATATVSVAPMVFPTSAAPQYTNVTQSTAITVNASNGLPYTVSLNKGIAGSSTARYWKKASGVNSTQPYYLYKDAARTIQWGDSDQAATYTSGSSVAGTGTGANQTLTVYGKHYIDYYSTGTYTDGVTVTVNY